MKKKIKRILSVLLAVLMVISVISLSAGATEIVANGTCGENLVWTLDSEGTLTITGTGDMEEFDHISHVPWSHEKDTVKKVIINSGVTSITNNALEGMNELKYVSISETVAEMDTFNSRNPFKDCDKLEEIFVNSENPFFKSDDGILYNKDMTVLRVYPSGKQGESFIIPESVTKTGDEAFYGCKNLKDVYIPDSVTQLSLGVFSACSELVSVRLPDGISYIDQCTFLNCAKLTNVNIPYSVECIGVSAFCGCESLKEIDIHSNITSIRDGAFGGSGISTITIDKNVEFIGSGAFGDCQSLIAIFADSDNLNFSSVDGVLYNKDKTALIQYPAGNTAKHFEIPEGVTEIKGYAFTGCNNLSDVKFPSTLTTIGDYAFKGCNNLSDVKFPVTLTTIGIYAFNGCNGLTSVAIPDGVTSLFGTFWECENLKSVTIPKSITSLSTFGYTFGSYLTDVFYMGTEKEWKNIEGHDEWYFDRATIRYNSCPHSGIVIQPAVEPACEEYGYTEGLVCPVCGVIKEQTQIEATGHHFDEFLECTVCGVGLDCSCMCHQTGFMGFIWSILRIFYMIFGMNPVCECGRAHY
ncbi:MAG: leucine-rich repeat domain-containing protein [Clostridia bacterium]|nr:leucine-rich repeat domain-containing protein [Clostridia bacterium]